MTLREAEQQSHRISERDRALDDQRVMTLAQWCEVNGFSWWTGQRLIKAGKGPKILQLSPAGLASPFAQIANGSRQGSVRDRNRPEACDPGPEMKDGVEQQPSSIAIAETEQGDRHDPVTVIINGEPVAKARPRLTRRGIAYTPAHTGVVLPFPQRGPWKIELLREGPAFLVRARDHGWLYGSLSDALADAQWLAAHAGVAIAILTDMPPREARQ